MSLLMPFQNYYDCICLNDLCLIHIYDKGNNNFLFILTGKIGNINEFGSNIFAFKNPHFLFLQCKEVICSFKNVEISI